MTILEFEAWVSEHRSGLLAVAKKRAAKSQEHMVELDGEDILQSALVEIVRRLDRVGMNGLWTYAVKTIRSVANHTQAAEVARFKYQEEAANDTPPPATLRARELNKMPRNAKGRIDPTAAPKARSIPTVVEWDGPMPGIARWRFQTLRDDRLFDERAIRSLADSMHRASARYRHHGEHGFSFTEFGQENVR